MLSLNSNSFLGYTFFPEENEIEDVSPEIRNLVRKDLLRNIITSNRKLVKGFHLKTPLKNNQDLKILVQQTEETIFFNHPMLKEYLEACLTLYIFLSDPNLSRDMVLFRFMLNIDMDDIYLDPTCIKSMLADLWYCDASCEDKYECIKDISSQIRERIPMLAYDYLNGQECLVIRPLVYDLNDKTKKEMKKYRQKQLDNILHRLYKNKTEKVEQEYEIKNLFSDSESEDDFMVSDIDSDSGMESYDSYVSLLSESEDEDFSHHYSFPCSKSDDEWTPKKKKLSKWRKYLSDDEKPSPDRTFIFDTLVQKKSDIKKGDWEEDEESMEEEENESESEKESDKEESESDNESEKEEAFEKSKIFSLEDETEEEEEKEEEIIKGIKGRRERRGMKGFKGMKGINPTLPFDLEEEEDEKRVVEVKKINIPKNEKNCFLCRKNIHKTSYITPFILKNEKKLLYFCNHICMEKWDYKKCK